MRGQRRSDGPHSAPSVPQRTLYLLARDLCLTGQALGVALQQDFDRVACSLGDRGCWHTAVEPRRHGRMAEVVRPPCEWCPGYLLSERSGARCIPHTGPGDTRNLSPTAHPGTTDRLVSVDFAGFSDETLHGTIAEPLDQIRAGRLRPQSVAVRLPVPDPEIPWSLPATVDNLDDSPLFRERARGIMERHTAAIVDSINELGELGLVDEVTAQIRVYPPVPMFKLYIINQYEAFFGYYPAQEHTIELDGEKTPMWDLMGKDTVLFHHSTDDPEPMLSLPPEHGHLTFGGCGYQGECSYACTSPA